MWNSPGARAAVDCGEMDGGDVREEIVLGMPVEESRAAMGARRSCRVTCRGWSDRHRLSLPTQPAPAAEQERGWPIKRLAY